MEASFPHPDLDLDLSERERAAIAQLSNLEKAVLIVLDDQFISASVVRERTRLNAVARSVAQTNLRWNQPTAIFAAACSELERRGLAEGLSTKRFMHWRRARA